MAATAILPLFLLLLGGLSYAESYIHNWNHSTSTYKGRPTLVPARNFNPRAEADTLRAALNPFTNEDTLIAVLTKRTDSQRINITKYYNNLRKDLEWKTSFAFKDLMVNLATPLAQVYTGHLKEALRFSTSIKEDLVVELLCTLDNKRLRSIQDTYQKVSGRTIAQDLSSYSLNKFTSFLASYVEGTRDESSLIDWSQVQNDAKALKDSGRLKIDGKSSFRDILVSRSYLHLAQVFLRYHAIAGNSISHAIERDFTGNVKKGLSNVVRTIMKRPEYFAEILHSNMKTSFSKDSTLIRILITRCEIDMEDVKQVYGRMYSSSLASAIWQKTSSNFRKGLFSLINVSKGSSSKPNETF